MANITNVTLPDVGKVLFEGNTYYVVGTQTAATNVWTGNLPEGVDHYYDGLTIEYYLPVAGTSTGATLNLSGKGAKPVYRQGGESTTTHYPAKSIIHMTYVINSGLNSGNGCFLCTGYYDSNSNDTGYYVRNYYNYYVAGANKIFPYTIIMQNKDGRWESIVTSSSTGTSKTRNTHGFLINNPVVMYANATYNENGKVGDTYIWQQHNLIDHRYSFNTANNATSGTTSKKPVYLVGTISNGLFYLDATWWTQSLPADGSGTEGKVYIYIGDAYDYYRMSFVINQKWFIYSNGKIRDFFDGDTLTSSMITTALGYTPYNSTNPNGYITSNHAHGNISSVGIIASSANVDIANNDRLVITDSSDSNKVKLSDITFDGSTATKCLTQKGDWASFTNNSGTVTSVGIANGGGLSVSGSPITTSGIMTISHANSGVTSGTYGTIATTALEPGYGGTFNVPAFTVDAKGHITSAGNHTVKIPASDNIDTKVTQTATTTNANYEILFSNTADNTDRTEGARKTSTLLYNPNLGSLTLNTPNTAFSATRSPAIYLQGANSKNAAFKISNTGTNIDIGWDWTSGAGAGVGFRSSDSSDGAGPGGFVFFARKDTSGAKQLIGKADGTLTWDSKKVVVGTGGNSTQPVYVNSSGQVATCTYRLAKSVPSDAVFTDEKVKQTAVTIGSGLFPEPILFSNSSDTSTEGTRKSTSLAYIPNDEKLIIQNTTTGSRMDITGDTLMVSQSPDIGYASLIIRSDGTYIAGEYLASSGKATHNEGAYNVVSGNYSHAEGGRASDEGNLASGQSCHAEGLATTASGNASHAEGGWNLSSGSCSHTDGYSNTASGENSHAEGRLNIVSGNYAHAEGWYTTCTGKCSHAEGYKTCAHGSNSSDADSAHAEGYQTSASGLGAHAEGHISRATGTGSHAEGNTTRATGTYSHAEGDRTTASGESSHAEGRQCKATDSYAHCEGYQSLASGTYSHAEGYCTTASAGSAHSEGYGTSAHSKYSHAEGYKTSAFDEAAHASGAYTSANNLGSVVLGHFNGAMTTGGKISNTTGTAFLIGKGTSAEAPSNAFSVQYNGVTKAASTITASTTADYAEMFEWYDENPNDEDRVGYFITFEDGNKIRIVNNENDYILGISSGDPFVLGNGDCDYWTKLELRDDFNRVIYEPAQKMIIDEETGEFVPVYDEEGNPVYEGTRPKYNPDYDPTRPYISRLDRKEWQAVGMLGVLRIRQDGTLVKNGYCTIDYSTGKATFIDHYNKNDYIYRVIDVINDDVAEVVFK